MAVFGKAWLFKGMNILARVLGERLVTQPRANKAFVAVDEQAGSNPKVRIADDMKWGRRPRFFGDLSVGGEWPKDSKW